MKRQRILTLFLGLIMIISLLPSAVFSATPIEKTFRRVYLHAFSEKPLLTQTADRTTVYMGDTVNVSLAVDDPNMSENEQEKEYDLGGFTVKIYYDTRFFDFVPEYVDPVEKTKFAAIEYGFVADDWADEDVEGGTGDDEQTTPDHDASFDKPGFVAYSQGTHHKDGVPGPQGYAYATIFYAGQSLPYDSENEGYWYDIARLPLIPIQTGHTSVQVDISGDDRHTLELFAKDNPNKDEIKRSYDYAAENSGVFNITIADRSKPNPPAATPAGSTYTSAQKVKLYIDNELDKPGVIYYTLDGTEPTTSSMEYTADLDATGGIPISETTTLKAIVWREKDGRTSNVATHIYNIVPRAPILFNTNREKISNSYTEDWDGIYTESWTEDGYNVFASDQDNFDDHITAASSLYYTFSDLSPDLISDEPGNVFVGNNAETQWVYIDKDSKMLKDPITKLRTVRLVNVHKTARSSVSTYYLGVKPGAVLADPEPADVYTATLPVAVELSCIAPPTAEIYYTTNGANPRTNGIKYDEEIILTGNKTITAAAFYAGVWGDVYEFPYIFLNSPPETITAFNPPGWYEGTVGVALIPTEPGKKIYYSIDGGQPKEYTKSLILDKDTTITAYVEGDELNVQTFEYEVQPLPPVFAPESTQLSGAEWVTIFTPGCTAATKNNFELKFTVDGSDPTKDTVNPTGVQYRYNPDTHEAQVYVTDKTEIKALVVKYGEYVSEISSHKYEVVTTRPAAPTLVLSPGHYTTPHGETLTTVFKEMAGVEIFYTYGVAGNPIADPDPNNPEHLYGTDTPIPLASNEETIIKAIAVKRAADGSLIMSDTVVYRYEVSEETAPVPPGSVVADKPSGTYMESTTPHTVTLSGSDDIWYNKGEGWQKYTQPLEIPYDKASVTLYIRDGETGTPIPYVYHFEPPAPVIKPTSGVYNGSVTVEFDFPEGDQYRRYIQQSDGGETLWQGGDFQQKYNESVSFEVYVVNTVTGVMSKHIYRDYIITDAAGLGDVFINWPYSQTRISKHLLSTDDYIKGITYGGTYGSNNIIYQIRYTPNGGSETAYSPEFIKDDNLPFIPTKQMEDLTVKYWIEGQKEDAVEHTIEFIDLDMPTVRLSDVINSSGNYPQNTKAWIQNQHKDKANVVVFYTTNGMTPDSKQSTREWFAGTPESGELTLANTTTIKAVYFSACGNSACPSCSERKYHECPDGVYGEVFTGIYPVVESMGGGGGGGIGGGGFGGGGGGGQVIDNTRKYTIDIFGNEHPTHIGYINGYPDGSVRPDGDITREEITAILYRITNHDYEAPFIATGDAFPDVESGRWSAHDIEYMAQKEVVQGYPDGEFKPAQNLTRAEFAALIFRFAGIKEADIENPFPDLAADHWAYREVLALVNSGLVEGYEDGTFKPQDYITRAEVMTVVNKLLGRKPMESYVKSLHFNPYTDLVEDKWYYVTVLEATITHNYWLNETGYEYKWEDWK